MTKSCLWRYVTLTIGRNDSVTVLRVGIHTGVSCLCPSTAKVLASCVAAHRMMSLLVK